jgi:hypothetical protein
MRPRKEVLLVMKNEAELGIWKMKLEVWGYRAQTCESTAAALEHLRNFPVFAAATSLPSAALALAARMDQVLLFGGTIALANLTVGRFEPQGPALEARVREALRILVVRKRGPLRGTPASIAGSGSEKKPMQPADRKPVKGVAAILAAVDKRRA